MNRERREDPDPTTNPQSHGALVAWVIDSASLLSALAWLTGRSLATSTVGG